MYIYILLDTVLATDVNKYSLASARCQPIWRTLVGERDLFLAVAKDCGIVVYLNQSQLIISPCFGQSANHGVCRPYALASAGGITCGGSDAPVVWPLLNTYVTQFMYCTVSPISPIHFLVQKTISQQFSCVVVYAFVLQFSFWCFTLVK